MIELKEGDNVEVLESQEGCFNSGDKGVIVDMTSNVDIGENCIVEFSGNKEVFYDGRWWVKLSELKLIEQEQINK